ncbi:MAG: SMP-30/gluconolactonase/LRE family protein, partial [Acidimicrobiales bacterium]|nr:SMP-30/gluconolactonase/LRE family protein [Acidimicrobiales bacterium]
MGSLNSSPLDVGGLAVALIDGLAFPEAPRWRADRLWYSDIFGGRVGHVGLDGSPATVLELDDHPSGLGWLPDGDLIVVSMQRRLLLRVDADGRTNVHADLTPHITWPANDLLVLPDGVAYVGHFGFDRQHGTTPRAPASLLCVEPDGTVRTAASDLEFPNGMATRQGPEGEPSVLVVAESGAGRITEFDIGPGG